ncbi:MAG: YfhO family protein, partial [Oscillospiraceae bacterium]|nr:YfhO family protein [Oscillospiraceae bacterium]
MQRAVLLTTAACVVCTGTVVYFGKVIGIKGETYREQAIYGAEKMSISYENDADSYFRVDISENLDNYPMFWGLSCMRCFQSVVNPSIMDFYESIGISRDVSSRADISSYTLRGLFSVKYYFDQIKEDENGEEIRTALELPGFVFDREENGFRIYRNDYYIPMGFAYDYYVAEDVLEDKSDAVKEHVLIKALVLDETQAEKYADIIENVPQDALAVSETQYLEECTLRREQSCTDFSYDSKGFVANIGLDAPKLVFFSVPYESGWTATVNSIPVDVERVSNGFMAVRCEAGENEIIFSYELPGLRYGLYLTLFGLVLLVLYMAFSKPLFSAKRGTQQYCYDYTSASGVRAAKAYAYHLAKHDTQKDITVKEDED